jgi:hypothetical protein
VRPYVGVTFGVSLVTNFASLTHLVSVRNELRPRLTAVTTSRVKKPVVAGVALSPARAVGDPGGFSRSLSSRADGGGRDGGGASGVRGRDWPALGFDPASLASLRRAAVREDWRWLDRNAVRGTLFAATAAAGGVGDRRFRRTAPDPVAPSEVLWGVAFWIVAGALGRVPDLLLTGLGAVWFQVRTAVVFSPWPSS